jgi:hypothetical protein
MRRASARRPVLDRVESLKSELLESVPAAWSCGRFPIIAFKSIVRLAHFGNAALAPGSLYLVKLDNPDRCGHTQITMIRSARALEPRTPLAARLLAPGLVILTVIVILPL